MLCLSCQHQTSNPKFCSHSCSAKYNNMHSKRNRMKPYAKFYCKGCKELIGVGRKYCKQYCTKCQPNKSKFNLNTTLEELFNILPKFQANARLRMFSRTIFNQSKQPKVCQNCGYSKFIEVCHIKPVSSFTRTATLAEVNALDNLIALCPNCHWELDNGLLTINSTGGKNRTCDACNGPNL